MKTKMSWLFAVVFSVMLLLVALPSQATAAEAQQPTKAEVAAIQLAQVHQPSEDMTVEVDPSMLPAPSPEIREPSEAPTPDSLEVLPQVGFPATSCRGGYRQVGERLCISFSPRPAQSYANAMVVCRDQRGRVASYGDLRYLYERSTLDSSYNPSGRWIGNFVGDDTVLCGNRSITFDGDPDTGNFEGQCDRFGVRQFWCAHDRL